MAKMIIKSLFLTLSSILLLIGLNLQAQHSFQVLFESTNDKGAGYIMEDINGNFLMVGTEYDPVEKIYNNKIWKVTSTGDTSSFQIDLGNDQSGFNYIDRTSDTSYLIMGTSGDTSNWLNYNELIILETDTLFNMKWMKKYSFAEYLYMSDTRVLKDDFGYYIVGNIAKIGNSSIRYPYFFRTNFKGDTLRTKIFNTYFGMAPIWDAIFSPDSTHIWWFSSSPPSPNGRDTRREVDTLFNFTREDTLTWSVSGTISTKLVSDSTLLLSCDYNLNSNPQDDDVGIFLYDNNLEALNFNRFGAPDTVDYPGREEGIDFRDPDTIFFTGMKNVIFSFYPEDPSWIMIGQLDANLQPRYLRFYGGDAYYTPMHIIATSDGGCLIHSSVYNNTLDIDDFLIMKLNPEGLITGTKPLIAPLRYAIVRPNPANNLLIVEYTNQKGILSIFDVNGKIVHQEMIQEGRNNIDISRLNAGFYIYQIKVESEAIESGKFIKL